MSPDGKLHDRRIRESNDRWFGLYMYFEFLLVCGEFFSSESRVKRECVAVGAGKVAKEKNWPAGHECIITRVETGAVPVLTA